MSRWNALILAGDRGPEDSVAKAAGVRTKAFAEIGGKPMIAYVIAALEGAPEIGEITVSIAKDAPALPDGVRRLDAARSPATSAYQGLSKTGAPLLITTADHPLLTSAMISDFLKGADARGLDAAAGASEKSVVEQAGNPAKRTWLRLADGWISGCNLFAIRNDAGAEAIRFWTRIEAERKKPLRMARQIGLTAPLLYLLGRLSRRRIEEILSRKLGAKAGIVLLDHPEAAHDVDKPGDMEFAKAALARR